MVSAQFVETPARGPGMRSMLRGTSPKVTGPTKSTKAEDGGVPLRPGELVFAALMVAAALYAFREAYAISGFTGLTTGGAMPMVASGVMVVSGLVILRDAFRRRRVTRDDEGILAYLFPLRLLAFVGLIAAFALAIPWIGFTPAACIFVFTAIAMLWKRGILPAAAVTALAMVAIYAVFRLVFKVVLPTGSLWQ